MSRTASDRTMFIRGLLAERKGELTHQEVRPLLEAAGYDLAVQPPNKSDAYSMFESHIIKMLGVPEKNQPQFKIRKKHMDNAKLMERALAKCKFEPKVEKALRAEIGVRMVFDSESNDFNVIKSNWSKNPDGVVQTSRKPDSSKNTKAKVAAATPSVRKVGILPKPKHRRDAVTVAVDNTDSIDLVVKNGGVVACETRVAELRAEADALEAAVKAVNALQERLSAAA